jgi:hypothetical protein
MPNNNSTEKPSSTSTYTGTTNPPMTSGSLQTAGWGDPNSVSYGCPQIIETLESVPASVRVQLALSGITKLGPNQYAATLSLSGDNTLQLTPNSADAQQNPTTAVSPNVFSWTFYSRNIHIATVDSSGLVTAVGRGECEILIQSPRAVNAAYAGVGTPADGVQASLQVTVLA